MAEPGVQVQAGASAPSQALAIGDLIRIDLLGDRPLTLQTRLDERGSVTLPMAGEVRAVGLTPAQLETALAESLRKGGSSLVPRVSLPGAPVRAAAPVPAPVAGRGSPAAGVAPAPMVPGVPTGRLDYRLGVGDLVRIQV
ncbi:MAG TPA: polysaccharide biosynthesis/export family protein, partial [Solimonas sp.]|nr:polysaccharide biosynthesis/export family protein [Solimonas sp.]